MAATANPCKLMRGLRRVAIEIGIRIYERTSMLSFMPGPMVTLHTPDDSPLVGKMVLAINAWMAIHFPQFERTLVVSSDMVITEKYPGLLQRIGLKDSVSALDSRTFVFYYRITEYGRLMMVNGGNTFAWHGRILLVFDQCSPYEQQLKHSLHEFFLTLAGVPITARWNRPSERSVTGLPFFGRLNDMPNVSYGFGYSGNGVGPGYMGDQLLWSLMLDPNNPWSRSPLATSPWCHFPQKLLRYRCSLVVRNSIRRKELAEDQDR